jgi:putative transposase
LPVEPVRSTTKERIETVRFGKWVEEILKTKNYVRESKWSQSIAVGSKSFVEGIKEKLGIRAKGRKVGES